MNEQQIKLLKILYQNAYYSLTKIEEPSEPEWSKEILHSLLEEIQKIFPVDDTLNLLNSKQSEGSSLFINQKKKQLIRTLIEIYQMDDYFAPDEHPYSVYSTLQMLKPILEAQFDFSYEEDLREVPYECMDLYELLSTEGLIQKVILNRLIWVHPKHIVFDEKKEPIACVTSMNDRQLKAMYFVFGDSYVRNKVKIAAKY